MIPLRRRKIKPGFDLSAKPAATLPPVAFDPRQCLWTEGGTFVDAYSKQNEDSMGSGTLFKTDRPGAGSYVQMGLLGLLAILAISMGAKADDLPFAIHMFIFAAAAILAVIFKARTSASPPQDTRAISTASCAGGAIATVFWGVVGFLVGVVVALQLAYPGLNPDLEWFNFGRLRPAAHLGGDLRLRRQRADLPPRFYVVQRTCRARLALGNLAWFVFWGYQLFIVLAATGYLLGVTEGREYAEPEWYVDLWLTVVWVAYLPGLLRHAPEAQGTPHLRGQLVLPRLHRDHRDAAHRQQPGDPGVVLRLEELLDVLGRAGRADAVVVRPQRGGLLPHRGLPRHDVLLRAEAGRTARSIPTGCRSSTSGR